MAGPASGVFLIMFAIVGICYYRDIDWLGRHGRLILDLVMIAFLIALSFQGSGGENAELLAVASAVACFGASVGKGR